MTYRDFALAVSDSGLSARQCSRHHWQILDGKRLVNVWANSKRGFRYQVRDEKSRTGTLADAIQAAGPPPPPPSIDPPWSEATADRPLAASGEPHRGLVRRAWRWLW